MFSDFMWNFRKLPFPSHLGKYFLKFGKISAKIHEIGKIKATFGLRMTPIYGLKNGQIKSLMLYPSVSVCPSVRPSVLTISIDNLSIYSRNFFKFCIHIVIGDEWYGIVNGQNPSIFNGVTALFIPRH